MDKSRATLMAVGLLAALLGLVGSASAATGNVDIEDYRFAPAEIRIEAGDRVRWTSQGEQTHTVTTDDAGAADFDSGRLGQGEAYSYTFSQEGTFAYHCEIHSSMSGVVQVGSPASETTSPTAPRPASTTTTSTTATTQPAPTTTTTQPRPAPPATTTTAPPAPTTTVTTARAPSGAESPAPTPATAPTTTTRPAATTTTAPPDSTTTGPTTTTTVLAAGEPGVPLGPEVPPPPQPQEEDGEEDLAGQTAAPPRRGSDGGGGGIGSLILIVALLGAGGFGGWTLWKLRPGDTA